MLGALAAWGQLDVTGWPGGGHRNTVLELRRGQERLVARRSRRPPASLDWEVCYARPADSAVSLPGHSAQPG